MVKFLITRKANVNLAEPCGGFTALHFAYITGIMSIIELLMSKGAKHDVRTKLGGTPLHHQAAGQGHKEAVAYLLDHGADINAVDDIGCSALMCAAEHNHLSSTFSSSEGLILILLRRS